MTQSPASSSGHLGHLTLNIPWANLTSKPAEIIIEDLYLLAIPAAESKVDLEEDEVRAQAAKQERLKNAEVLRASGKDLNGDEDQRSQGVFESLIGKIVNNVQITIKNIHVRYEDKLSVPGVCVPAPRLSLTHGLNPPLQLIASFRCWCDFGRVHRRFDR